MRYIELNPVRAGMVAVPADYPWSSYRQNAWGSQLCRIPKISAWVGLPMPVMRCIVTFKHQLSENSITEVREATNKSWGLGNDRFKKRIQDQLGRRVEPKARGGAGRRQEIRTI